MSLKSLTIAQQIEQQHKQGLQTVLAHFQTKSKLARALEVSPMVVQQWFNRGRIAATAAKRIEAITIGAIKKEDLRPEVIDWSK